MKTRNIKQSINFICSAHDIYEAFLDEKKHAELIGANAKIERKAGGSFSLWDGQITGKTIELVPDRKIVQEWRFDYPDWPKEYFSKITISLKEVDGKTRLNFLHTGVPQHYALDIGQGWKDYYWTPLKDMLKRK